MLFYTLKDWVAISMILAVLDWCAVQVGRDSWASGSRGDPATTHLAEAGEDRTVLALSLYTTIPPGSRETASTNQSVRQDARKRKMDKHQAITYPSLFLCAQVEPSGAPRQTQVQICPLPLPSKLPFSSVHSVVVNQHSAQSIPTQKK